MAEYIEREAVIDLITRRYENPEICTQEINSIPDADVAPVVHGRWEHLGGDEWLCTACGFVITTEGSWDKPTKNTVRIAARRWTEVTAMRCV